MTSVPVQVQSLMHASLCTCMYCCCMGILSFTPLYLKKQQSQTCLSAFSIHPDPGLCTSSHKAADSDPPGVWNMSYEWQRGFGGTSLNRTSTPPQAIHQPSSPQAQKLSADSNLNHCSITQADRPDCFNYLHLNWGILGQGRLLHLRSNPLACSIFWSGP